MVLVLGTLFLAIGLVFILNVSVFKILPKYIRLILVVIIAFMLMVTGTVHGIWLGLTFLIVGFVWIQFQRTKQIIN